MSPAVIAVLVFGVYPDPNITPGSTFQVDVPTLCRPGYPSTVRNVPVSEKMAVFKSYNIPWSEHSKYEVDHFISLENSGSNDISNLWPEPLHLMVNGEDLGAKSKDKAENWIHKQICTNKMTIQEAEKAIKDDWVAVYRKCCQ